METTTHDNSHSLADRLSVRIGALAIYTAGGLFWAFLPYFIGLQTETGGMTQTQAGSLGSGYLIGFTLASVTALWWIPRFNWRIAVAGAAVLIIIALYILQGTQAYSVSIASVGVIGLMMGTFWTIAYRIFAGTSNPDRSFATGIIVSYTALAAISYGIGRFVVPAGGLSGAAYLISAIILVLAFSALLIPVRLVNDNPVSISYRPSMSVVLALTGILMTGFAFAAIWAFAERIGVNAGFERDAISPVIASNLLASAGGSVLATILGTQLGRKASLFAGLLVMIMAIISLSGAETFWLYATAIAGLGFGVGFVMPYQMATLAVLDKEGRFVVLIAAAQGLGSAAGPLLGGVAADAGGIQVLILMAVLTLILSGAAFFMINTQDNICHKGHRGK